MQRDGTRESGRLPLSEIHTGLRLSAHPRDFPGLITFWDFGQRSDDGTWSAAAGEPYVLKERAGPMAIVQDESAPFGDRALRIMTGQWLAIERSACPRLDIHGPGGTVTLVAWIRRGRTDGPCCEFIAGQWNESSGSRQYGLFLDIRVWGERDQACGHLSTVGGATPGYGYCMDGPVGATPIAYDSWHGIAMSYDGTYGHIWVDGKLDVRPGLNPYLIPGGLHDGGPGGSDFTVGAVDRSGSIGNFFTGRIGGLAVFDRVLTPAEIWAICTPGPS